MGDVLKLCRMCDVGCGMGDVLKLCRMWDVGCGMGDAFISAESNGMIDGHNRLNASRRNNH